MDKGLYVAMSGAKEMMLAQAVHSQNLANSKTVGFSAALEQSRAMPVFGDGFPTRVYSMTESPGTDFRAGALLVTDNPLDVALPGDGFLSVLDGQGKEAYTRVGDLHIDELGRLKNAVNQIVVGQGGPIAVPPAQSVTIEPDGTISFVPLGASEPVSQILDRLKLVKPNFNNFVKGEDALFRTRTGAPLEPDASIGVIPGALNASNVDAIGEMVSIISAARQFEMNVKLMNTMQEDDAQASTIMQMNG